MAEKLKDRDWQLIQHSLESYEDNFFLVPELQKEIKATREKVLNIRFPMPKEKKGFVNFRTSDGRVITFKVRK